MSAIREWKIVKWCKSRNKNSFYQNWTTLFTVLDEIKTEQKPFLDFLKWIYPIIIWVVGWVLVSWLGLPTPWLLVPLLPTAKTMFFN